jgi:hypothetical protein
MSTGLDQIEKRRKLWKKNPIFISLFLSVASGLQAVPIPCPLSATMAGLINLTIVVEPGKDRHASPGG